ncbi:hypothetical protein SEA_ZENTENO07_36 [Mycobacterium phage Zenteno07]|nr:hypothetical protein SEA_ZENTENO07_36 [Mycobacterium phage Zenteno07]
MDDFYGFWYETTGDLVNWTRWVFPVGDLAEATARRDEVAAVEHPYIRSVDVIHAGQPVDWQPYQIGVTAVPEGAHIASRIEYDYGVDLGGVRVTMQELTPEQVPLIQSQFDALADDPALLSAALVWAAPFTWTAIPGLQPQLLAPPEPEPEPIVEPIEEPFVESPVVEPREHRSGTR